MNIWQKLRKEKPAGIVGLSPMDGVTDLAMRIMTGEYGRPDLMMTEFVNVEGLQRGPKRLWRELWTWPEKEKTPVIAQLYGLQPTNFFEVSRQVKEGNIPGAEKWQPEKSRGSICGIDLNMGCPAKNVAQNGAGAGLIKNKNLAQEIYLATKEGVNDELPVSIKTRIGHSQASEYEDWLGWILTELKPAALTIHGRTYKQGYSGNADWQVIGEVVKLAREIQSDLPVEKRTVILGNGDVQNRTEAELKKTEFGVDGVLIGRATMGDPLVFKTVEKAMGIRQENPNWWIKVMLEHSRLYEELYGAGEKYNFLPMRKHLAWYVRGVTGASKIRMALCQANSSADVEMILQEFGLI